MHETPPIINPSWEHVFKRILVVPNPNQRIDRWCRELLFPYIEKHPEEFCYKVYVEDIRVTDEQAWDGDRLVEVDGLVIQPHPRNPLLSLSVTMDPYIVKLDTTFDNREIPVFSHGWVHTSHVHVQRSDTRVSILLRQSTGLLRGRPEYIYLFAAQGTLSDLSDWLVRGAKVPLTVTKLPFKEAKRLSDEWHEQEVRRKIKKAKQYAGTPGDRELVGRLTVAPDNNGIPEETYEVFWLKDEQSLKYESIIQHHCVDGYWSKVFLGQCVILHMQNADPSKREDRWTVELALLKMQPPSTEGEFDPPAVRSFPVVRQMRGIANCSPHPGMLTGFGNLFLHHQGEEGLGKSVLFTKDSWIKAQVLVDKLTKPFGILS